MTRWWVVARFEFLGNIRRLEFLILTLGLPIFSLAVMALTSIPNMLYVQHKLARTEPIGVGWIDDSHLFSFPPAVTVDSTADAKAPVDPLNGPPPMGPATFRFVHFDGLDEGKKELLASHLEYLYLIHQDYMQTGRVDAYTVSKGLFSNLRIPPLRTLLERGLLQHKVEPVLLERVADPVHANQITMTSDGQVITSPYQEAISQFFLPYGMMFLLLMSLLGSSSYLLRSLSEEKENRIMEILLAAVSPAALFYGKIIGLGLLGLVQLAFWLILTLPVLGMLVTYLHIPAIAFVFFLIYFSLGYMFFAGLIAGVGAIGSTEKESNQILGIFFFLAVLPMMVMPIIVDDLNGLMARIFSMIPFTAPMVMMVRFIKETPPIPDILMSLLCMVLGIAIVYRLALKVFRMGLLMYGKTPNLRELWSWLRAA